MNRGRKDLKMLTKKGIDLTRLNKEIRRGLSVIDCIYQNHGSELTVTSTYDGVHKKGSKHYDNDAVDCRLWDLDGSTDGVISVEDLKIAKVICGEIQAKLGNLFDVILERDHIHVEYDIPVIKRERVFIC
jgi:hypothetical protein